MLAIYITNIQCLFRRGIAQLLYKQCEVVARSQQIKKLRVDTNSVNVPMNNLIVKCNYKLIGTCILNGKEGVFNCYEKVLDDN